MPSSRTGSRLRAVRGRRRGCSRWCASCSRWVRTRLDWKYALSLGLTDSGFDFSVLSEFRDRLVADDRASQLLESILVAARQAGLLRSGGRARTDSTHVLANIRKINRLELVGETVRAALEQVAEVAAGWLGPRVQPHWSESYTRRIEASRLPAGEQARLQWAAQTARDGGYPLDAIDADRDATWLGNLPQVGALRRVWARQCVREGDGQWHYRKECLLAGTERIDTPHDVQARWSSKRSTSWSGYKVHLTGTDDDTPHLVTQVETTMATTTDLAALITIQTDLDTRDLTPGEHYLDAGYVTIEVIAEANPRGTTIVGPVSLDSSWQAKAGLGFDRAAFHIDWDNRTAICPRGNHNTEWTDQRHAHGPGAAIRFAVTD